jgi:type I site-specific restriction endonuclease
MASGGGKTFTACNFIYRLIKHAGAKRILFLVDRSNLWRQVLEYFDSFIIGLTATPSMQTLGFFNQNLVMEYSHEQAVADSVNVGFEVYRIRTLISEHGSTVNAGLFVDKRDKLTRKVRWQQLDDDFKYAASELDRSVVAKDQIRTIIQTLRDRLFTEIFPGRTEVPKTLIFAKDDSHADDIVQIVREEFGKGKRLRSEDYVPNRHGAGSQQKQDGGWQRGRGSDVGQYRRQAVFSGRLVGSKNRRERRDDRCRPAGNCSLASPGNSHRRSPRGACSSKT